MTTNRSPLTVIALIAVAVLVSACGSSAPTADRGGSGGNSTAAKAGKAVKFARCMRKRGVSQFPDPPASGNLTLDQIANGSSLNTNSPAFTQALDECKALEPAGFTGTRRSAGQQSTALRFAACMRRNGVPDFPDPTPNSPLIDTNNIPSANRPNGMSALNHASQRCGSLIAALIGRHA